jgi:hypothetical protein
MPVKSLVRAIVLLPAVTVSAKTPSPSVSIAWVQSAPAGRGLVRTCGTVPEARLMSTEMSAARMLMSEGRPTNSAWPIEAEVAR